MKMKFQDKMKSAGKDKIWDEYCGYLDLSIEEYMYIQHRLLEEQLGKWCASGLGQSLVNGATPQNYDEMREQIPLTEYSNYADTLLARKAGALPGEPIIWIQTTWEGGLRPTKVAPYTREMLNTYRHNVMATMMLSSSTAKGDYSVKKGSRVLYGGAPLPYATGLLPSLINEEIDFEWLPDADATKMSFSERIKEGFASALNGGLDYFFATGSVANYITENFGKSSGGGKTHNADLKIALRYLRAKHKERKTGEAMLPRDIFKIKGFVCAGTDAKCYRENLKQAWGAYPIEIAAGTESTCIGAETWEHHGMVFFPDSCFYEFIPEAEMRRNLDDPGYIPRTCLMDSVTAGETYELVISVLHGGAFMRYRIGDVYHCLSADVGCLPKFSFVDRVPTIIDIAGFTRITQTSVEEVIAISKLSISDWLAKKEFDDKGVPFLHMYIEMDPRAQHTDITSKMVLTEHLSVYFKYFDSDYKDLKKLLGMEPLEVTILKSGMISGYEDYVGRTLPKINPSALDVIELLDFQRKSAYRREGARL